MAKTIAKLNVMLVASTTPFVKSLKSAEKRVQSFGARINRFGANIGTHLRNAFRRATIAASAFAAGLVYLTKATGDAIDKQTKMARRLGMTYNQLKAIEIAAGFAGISSEELNKAFEKMLDTIGAAQFGEGTAVRAFEQIGITVDQLRAMRPEQQFNAIARAINSIQDPSERIAAARDIFGRGGGTLIELFRGGAAAIAEASEKMQTFGLALSDLDTSNIEFMNDRLDDMKKIFEGIGTQISAFVSPYIGQLAVDTEEWLKSLGGLGSIADTALMKFAEGLDWVSAKIDPIVKWVKRLWWLLQQLDHLMPGGRKGTQILRNLAGEGIKGIGAAVDFAMGDEGDTGGKPTFAERYDDFKRRAEFNAAERAQQAQNAPAVEAEKQRRESERAAAYYRQFGTLPPGMSTDGLNMDAFQNRLMESKPIERKRIARGGFSETSAGGDATQWLERIYNRLGSGVPTVVQ